MGQKLINHRSDVTRILFRFTCRIFAHHLDLAPAPVSPVGCCVLRVEPRPPRGGYFCGLLLRVACVLPRGALLQVTAVTAV
jgi:hypothetical protein